ncbi:MAG: hypothetical protein SV062_11035, partial [Thermodesulfobacteriota bacterium]|nr:hypothetical protein [Thermodesulfobacteriota bacterium]
YSKRRKWGGILCKEKRTSYITSVKKKVIKSKSALKSIEYKSQLIFEHTSSQIKGKGFYFLRHPFG